MSRERSLHQTSRALLVFLFILFAVSSIFIIRFFQKGTDTETSQKDLPPTLDMSDIRFLDARTLRAREQTGENLHFLDVRATERYQEKHILNSLSIKPQELLSTFPNLTGTPIFLIDETITTEILNSLKKTFDQQGKSFAILTDGVIGWQAAGGITISAGDPYSFEDQSKVTFIPPLKAQELLTNHVFILDVQTPLLYQQAHIPGAINIPLAELENRRSELPFTQSLLVYGTNDLEGFQAGVRLFDMNFLGSRTLEGGLTAWRNANLPTETK